MSWQSWWLFVGAVFLLSGTPGPNMLHVMRQSIAVGFARATATMAGCLVAIVMVLAASAAGLSAVLIAWPTLFDAIRYAGVAYLFYLGIKAWRSGDAGPAVDDSPLPLAGSWSRFRGGLLIGLTNPKLILFAAAFLPQFIDPRQPQVPQFAILVVTFAVIETGWYAAYGLGGRQLARYLSTPARRQLFDRLTGTLFIGFGAALLAARA